MSLALEGIRVIDVSQVAAAPMAARLLADFGADVIHVEHPARGDMWRGILSGPGARTAGVPSDINYVWENLNRNKRSITIDLSQDGGREIISRLLQGADVFLSNLRPRELKKFKLEYENLCQLNPRLIFANLTGYGKKGPDRDLPGYESTGYFFRSGSQYLQQEPGAQPARTPPASGDSVAGLGLAYGIALALFARQRTGLGQEVDVSLFQMGVFVTSQDIAGALVTGQSREYIDRKDSPNPLSIIYQTKDSRWLRLSVNQPDPYWPKVCQAIGRPDLEHDRRFGSYEPRIKNHAALFKILEETFLSKTLDEWKIPLTEAGLPWSSLQTPQEVVNDPQARANDFFVPFDHPAHGRMEAVANPINLSKTPAAVRMPAPQFSQHTEEVLLQLGYAWEDIERFKQEHVIA